jgi:hypothetical protein
LPLVSGTRSQMKPIAITPMAAQIQNVAGLPMAATCWIAKICRCTTEFFWPIY